MEGNGISQYQRDNGIFQHPVGSRGISTTVKIPRKALINIWCRLVEVERWKFIPRLNSTPFLESDRDFLHPSSMSPHDELTYNVRFFSLSDFLLFLANLDHLLDKIFSVKEIKYPPRQVSPREGCKQHVRSLRVLSLRNGVDIWSFVRTKVHEIGIAYEVILSFIILSIFGHEFCLLFNIHRSDIRVFLSCRNACLLLAVLEPVVGRDTFLPLYSASPTTRTPTNKTSMSPSSPVPGDPYDTKYVPFE